MADDKSKTTKADGGPAQSVALRGYGPTASLTNNPNAVPDQDAIQGAAFEKEDEYRQFYLGGDRDLGVLEPPYRLRQLQRLTQENNALGPCIEAMVTNIDGTGFGFDNGDDEEAEDAEDDANIDELDEFFAQPWPGMSFKKMRRLVRRDVESVGNGYLEVLRNAQGAIVFIRPIDGKMMRMIKLDQAVTVTKTLTRGGKDVEYKVSMRERRFCQLVNGITLVYFKAFGASRDLNKKTGAWAQPGQQLPANVRATEVLHFTALPDAHTPYGIPRWIAQVPSVMGSRKAEEFNLSYFDNGGIPPIMIVLQGGLLQSETRRKLEQMGSGTAAQNNRLQVLEVEPTGGSLEGNAPVAKVTVERFGGDRMADSMFENYDDKCEKRVRRAFRLSTVFIGSSEDLTFANAFAGYTVAEAQVFKPERDDFDEAISMSLIEDMGYEGYKLVSKPLVIEDATMKLQSIEMGLGTGEIDVAGAIQELNEATGTKLKMMTAEQKAQKQQEAMAAMGGGAPGQMTVDATGRVVPKAGPPGAANSNVAAGGAPGGLQPPGAPAGMNANGGGSFRTPKPPGGGAGSPSAAVAKHDGTLLSGAGETIRDLAHRSMIAMRKRDVTVLAECMAITSSFDEAGASAFKKACAELQFVDTTLDPVGLGMLSACTMNVLAREGQPGSPFLPLTKAEHDVDDEARDATGKWTAGGNSLAATGKLKPADHEKAVNDYVPDWVQSELNAKTDTNHTANGYKTGTYDTGKYVEPRYKSLEEGGLPITQKQATLVASYTKGSDYRINAELRSGNVSNKGLAYAQALNQTLTDLQNDPTGRFKAPPTVWRGIKTAGAGDREKLLALYQPGAVLQWNGFGSSATTQSTAKDFAGQGYGSGVLFKIKGKNAVKVKTLSAFENENETIFKAGTRFKVTGVTPAANSYEPPVIELEEEKKQDYKLYSGVKGDDTSAKDEAGYPIADKQMGLGLTGGGGKPQDDADYKAIIAGTYKPSAPVFKPIPEGALKQVKDANAAILAASTPATLDLAIEGYEKVQKGTYGDSIAKVDNEAVQANIATKQKALGQPIFKPVQAAMFDSLDYTSTAEQEVAKANLTIKKASSMAELSAAHTAAMKSIQKYGPKTISAVSQVFDDNYTAKQKALINAATGKLTTDIHKELSETADAPPKKAYKVFNAANLGFLPSEAAPYKALDEKLKAATTIPEADAAFDEAWQKKGELSEHMANVVAEHFQHNLEVKEKELHAVADAPKGATYQKLPGYADKLAGTAHAAMLSATNTNDVATWAGAAKTQIDGGGLGLYDKNSAKNIIDMNATTKIGELQGAAPAPASNAPTKDEHGFLPIPDEANGSWITLNNEIKKAKTPEELDGYMNSSTGGLAATTAYVTEELGKGKNMDTPNVKAMNYTAGNAAAKKKQLLDEMTSGSKTHAVIGGAVAVPDKDTQSNPSLFVVPVFKTGTLTTATQKGQFQDGYDMVKNATTLATVDKGVKLMEGAGAIGAPGKFQSPGFMGDMKKIIIAKHPLFGAHEIKFAVDNGLLDNADQAYAGQQLDKNAEVLKQHTAAKSAYQDKVIGASLLADAPVQSIATSGGDKLTAEQEAHAKLLYEGSKYGGKGLGQILDKLKDDPGAMNGAMKAANENWDIAKKIAQGKQLTEDESTKAVVFADMHTNMTMQEYKDYSSGGAKVGDKTPAPPATKPSPAALENKGKLIDVGTYMALSPEDATTYKMHHTGAYGAAVTKMHTLNVKALNATVQQVANMSDAEFNTYAKYHAAPGDVHSITIDDDKGEPSTMSLVDAHFAQKDLAAGDHADLLGKMKVKIDEATGEHKMPANEPTPVADEAGDVPGHNGKTTKDGVFKPDPAALTDHTKLVFQADAEKMEQGAYDNYKTFHVHPEGGPEFAVGLKAVQKPGFVATKNQLANMKPTILKVFKAAHPDQYEKLTAGVDKSPPKISKDNVNEKISYGMDLTPHELSYAKKNDMIPEHKKAMYGVLPETSAGDTHMAPKKKGKAKKDDDGHPGYDMGDKMMIDPNGPLFGHMIEPGVWMGD